MGFVHKEFFLIDRFSFAENMISLSFSPIEFIQNFDIIWETWRLYYDGKRDSRWKHKKGLFRLHRQSIETDCCFGNVPWSSGMESVARLSKRMVAYLNPFDRKTHCTNDVVYDCWRLLSHTESKKISSEAFHFFHPLTLCIQFLLRDFVYSI